jgi:hypothetical protein
MALAQTWQRGPTATAEMSKMDLSLWQTCNNGGEGKATTSLDKLKCYVHKKWCRVESDQLQKTRQGGDPCRLTCFGEKIRQDRLVEGGATRGTTAVVY